METLVFAIAVAVLAFGCGVVGLRLRTWLPERHAPDQAREMIAAMTGLLGLLLALVLGTLVGSSYTFYATQKADLETLAARTLQLDAALEAYGPETRPARDGLRAGIRESYDKVWGREKLDAEELTVRSVFAGMKKLDRFLLSLTPQTDAQKQVLATASAAAGLIEQTRLLMMLQLAGGGDFSAYGGHRRLLVAAVVLRLRPGFAGQRNGHRHVGLRRNCGRQRHLLDHGAEPTLFGDVSHSARRPDPNHSGARLVDEGRSLSPPATRTEGDQACADPFAS